MGDLYYEGQHDILQRQRTIIGENGQLQVVTNLPNNRLIDNQYALMVDQKTNYLVGKPFTLNCQDKGYTDALGKVFNKRFYRLLKYVCEDALNGGIGWLYGNQVDSLDALLKKVVGNGYTHTAFEVQKGVGLGWDITGLDQKKLETLLSKPWTTDGRTFSDRIWFKKQELVDSLQKELVQGLLRGDSPQKITDAIQKKFKVSRYQAARLVNTETSYFNALAAKETYKELGVKNVEILETLDSITCAFCASMDRKVVPMSEFQPGVTVPPFHPHCRGTTVPAIDEKYMGERAARDQDGKVYYVPGNMSYSEWKKTFVDNGSKDGLTLATIGSIIKNTVSMVKSEGSNVQTVGRIDIEKYRCITDEIATDEVIITPERIQHIEERHPGDYEQFVKYIADILANPDYILEANKPNTGVILKEIEENGEKFKVILRVKVESDPAEYRNSILSFWQIGETTWKKNVKNKKILYKRE